MFYKVIKIEQIIFCFKKEKANIQIKASANVSHLTADVTKSPTWPRSNGGKKAKN